MSEKIKNISRRNMLQQSTAMGAAMALPWFVPASALGAEAGRAAPSERITLGVIGIGPRATYDLDGFLKQPDCQCVAICDVQAKRREAGKQLIDKHYGNNDSKIYRDFREVLARSDIDAVLIGTGDRWHAPASILAAKAGKDIYSEKPCGLAIGECQALDDTIQKTGRVFQTGTQRRSVVNYQAAVQLAHSGKLGKLKTLYASVYNPVIKSEWLPGEPTPARDVVDWDLWLGPAPWRPFNHTYIENRGWQGYWDFTAGANLLDWGAHTVDICQWANQADDSGPVEFEMTDKNLVCRYANGVSLILDFLADPWARQRPGWVPGVGTCPVRFVGEAGWVETGDSGLLETQPASLKEEVKATISKQRERGLDVSAHSRNFLDCIKSRAKPIANSRVMRRSHTACLAAAAAWILRRKLQFDPVKELFINDDEANSLHHRAMRAPWASLLG